MIKYNAKRKIKTKKINFLEKLFLKSRIAKRKVLVKKRIRRNRGVSKFLKHTKLVMFGFLAFVFSTLVLALFYAYNFYYVEKTNARTSTGFSSSMNFGDNHFENIIIAKLDDKNSQTPKITGLYLFSARKSPNRYYIYNFPLEIEIKIANFNGEEKLKLSDAYQNLSENKALFLRYFTLNHLAIDANGYIILDEKDYAKFNDIFDQINYDDLAANLRLKNTLKIPSFVANLHNETESNLSLNDTLKILQYIKNTGKNSSTFINVSKYELEDSFLWDTAYKKSIDMSSIQKEGLKVLVLNASKNPKIPGLGNWGGRIVSNAGAILLSSENSFTDFNQNTIIVEEKKSETSRFLANALGIEKIIDLNSIDDHNSYNPEIFRSKITLILVDFFSK